MTTPATAEPDEGTVEVLALDLTDRIGLDLGPVAEAAARQHFRTAARYEWMFWDAAYRQEVWPV
jgi:thiaminase/transcriptional activator TenA